MNHVTFPFLIALFLCATAWADTLEVSRFATEGLSGWEKKIFKGETEYHIVKESEHAVIKAQSKSSASGYYKQVQLDPLQYRYLHWKWKIESPLKNQHEKSKAGDDYVARVYVVFPGFFFWQSKAINYVWGSHLTKDEAFPSPFTSNIMIVAVENGPDKAGGWVHEQRDILADYRRYFGGDPRKLGAIAIMTDTDNTGSSATAWYSDISLSNSIQ